MRGDWMDEAKRFEDTDKAVLREIKIAQMSCCYDAKQGANGVPDCIFGCGSEVDDDTGICPTCREHSANTVTCWECGTRWEKWAGQDWEKSK